MPSTVRNGIAYTDMVAGGNYRESFAIDSASVMRPVTTAWSTRRAFIRDMIGENFVLGTSIIRNNPELFSNTDFDPKIYCTAVETSQLFRPNAAGANPTGHSFDNIEYVLHYNALPYDIDTDSNVTASSSAELIRNVERTSTFAAENLQIPGSAFKWTTAPIEPIFSPPPKTFPTIEFTYTWHRVPRIPTANINNCIGKVNSAAFDNNSQARARGVPSGGFPAQTLLFLGGEPKVRTMGFVAQVGGIATEWDIVYKFLYRNNGDAGGGVSYGWNHLYRPNVDAFQLVTNDGTGGGTRLYKTADFQTLFQMV